MPEIKHTFLAGKMNKSLDDRLVPEGEYRDAKNIEITTDIAGSGDIGTVRVIKGNTALTTSDSYFVSAREVIGTFFDDKNNAIYYFVTDNIKHKIYRYKTDTETLETLVQGDFLNFHLDYKITGINLIENILFWTDDRNEPRRINVDKPALYYTKDYQISLASLAPYKSPSLVLSKDDNVDSNYIEDKFVRFSYRYKFEENEYSVYAPFSQSAFQLYTDGTTTAKNTITEDQEKDAYNTSELEIAINGCNKVEVSILLPNFSVLEGADDAAKLQSYLDNNDVLLKSFDVLMKESSSLAVKLVDTIIFSELQASDLSIVDKGIGNPQEVYFTYTYLSSTPKSTLAENQLIRVYDNIPLVAKSQEVTGNRIVYGNFEQEIPVPAKLDFTVGWGTEDVSSTHYQHLSLKQDRTYTIGIILSDIYGRTSPVILPKDNEASYTVPYDLTNLFVSNDKRYHLSIKFNNGCFDNVDSRWVSYSVVVKQNQQEYYNVYIPGLANYDGSTFTTIFSDNVNKIPRNSDTINNESEISSSDQQLKVRVENNSNYVTHVENKEGTTRQTTAYNFNIGSNQWQFNIVSSDQVEEYEANGTQGQTFQVDPVSPLITGSTAEVIGVEVYVDGLLALPNTHYTINKTGTTVNYITFVNEYTQPSGREIKIYKRISYQGGSGTGGNPTNIYSFTYPQGYYGGGSGASVVNTVEVPIYIYNGDGSTPLYSPTINNVVQENVFSKLLNVTGIGNLNSFSEIPEYSIISSNPELETGFYKADNNYLLANFRGAFGINIEGTSILAYGKKNQLAILETKPFESAIDIFYESSTNGLISDITYGVWNSVTYYNCFILKNANKDWFIEESRIRGGFNETSMDFGVQAFITDTDWPETTAKKRINSLIYSGIYNPRTNVNNSNQFPSGENITKSLDVQYGSIQKLFAEDNSLIVFQEEKVSSIPIDRDILYTAEGSPQLTASNAVFGDVITYAGNYGIGKNPESFAYYAGRKYFVDQPKGVVLRLSRDGITEISNYGMRTFFIQNLPSDADIYGMWDIAKQQYVLHWYKFENDGFIINIDKGTISYDESVKGWVSFYTYDPKFGGSIDGKFYTFLDGRLYEQYSSNNFYGNNIAGTITLILNQNPSVNKSFHSINYEGAGTWRAVSLNTDTDRAYTVNAFDNANQNDEDAIFVNNFIKRDNKYHANLINFTNPKENEIIFGGDISGVKGYFLSVEMQNLTDKDDPFNADTFGEELFSVSTNYNINTY